MKKQSVIAILKMLANVKPIKKEDVMKSLVKNVEKQADLKRKHNEIQEQADFFHNTQQKDKLFNLARKDNKLHNKFMHTIIETSVFVEIAASNCDFKSN